MNLKTLALGAAIFATVAAKAQTPFLTELYINPPGTDQGKESIEIQAPANFSFAGYYLLVIEGENNANKGKITARINLGTYSAGSNGLLLIRDGFPEFNPLPAPETSVVVFDFTPDIQNDAQTFALGFGNPPAVGIDLDAEVLDNGNGVLDNGVPLFTTVDSFAFKGSNTDNMPLEAGYATQLGGQLLGGHAGTGAWNGTYTGTPDLFYRVLNTAQSAPVGWACGDMLNPPVNAFQPTWDTDSATGFIRCVTYVSGLAPEVFAASVPNPDLGVKNFGFAVTTVATISGNLVLQNTADDGAAGTETITWTLSNGTNSYTSDFTVDDFGGGAYSFNIPSGAANGAYTLSFDGGTFLKSTFNVTLSGSSLTQAVSLRNGDIDSDGEVGPSDFEAVVAQFGGAGDADVDNDGEVGPSDFETIVANFGLGDE